MENQNNSSNEISQNQELSKQEKIKKEVMEWIKTILTAVVLALIITSFIRPTLVKGVSMFPTLDPNNYLMLYKLAYAGDKAPKYGDIVVFKSHLTMENGREKDLVKRVIAVGGDHIRIIDGKVYLNEGQLDENYINGDYTDGEIDIIVPEGYIFAMGDNRPNSRDSRDPSVGLIPESDIIGKVFIRLYPFNRIQSF